MAASCGSLESGLLLLLDRNLPMASDVVKSNAVPQAAVAVDPKEILEKLAKTVQANDNTSALLPVLFSLNGEPLRLEDHFVFKPLFNLHQPMETVLMCGRQVGKTTNIAVQSLLLAASLPYFTVTVVFPREIHAARFSTLYLSPLLRSSVISDILMGKDSVDQVFQKDFTNGSHIILTYAYDNPDRTRGIAATRLLCDETQDMLLTSIEIIKETLSHAKFGVQALYAGTPKTTSNTLATLWYRSSQAEWFIRCTHCTTNGKPTWNIPSPDHHLEKLLGPVHEKISERYPALLCHKCRQPISPRNGQWVHRYRDRIPDFTGYHVPQILLPHHYANPRNWATLLKKTNGPTYIFYNEVMGWPYDAAAAIVSEQDLIRASTLGENKDELAVQEAKKYTITALGVDWGGGGEDMTSFTTLALVGLCPDGKLHVIWGKRLLTPNDHLREAAEICRYCCYFNPTFMAHDYGGGGTVRETILVNAGFPDHKIVPMLYAGTNMAAVYKVKEPNELNPRSYILINKTKTIQILCALIKLGQIRFFAYNRQNPQECLTADFLNLKEERTVSLVRERYHISKQTGSIDDFVHAVNYACIAIWLNTRWPDMANAVAEYASEQLVE